MAGVPNQVNVPIPGSARFQQDTATAISRIKASLGPQGQPEFTSLTLSDDLAIDGSLTLGGLTANTPVYADGDKALQSITVGSSLSFSAPTLNTIQGIRTTDSPTFVNLNLSGSLDAGGWDGKPDPIQTHSTISGDLFCGSVGASVARLRVTSNANSGLLQWNRYFDGAASQQMDSSRPSWQIRMDGNTDYLAFSRSPAGSTTLSDILNITGGTGLATFSGKVRSNTGFNINGTDGVSDSGAGVPTALTISGGIVTAVTKNDWLDQSVKTISTPTFGLTTISTATNVPFVINNSGGNLAGINMQISGAIKWVLADRPGDSDNLYLAASPANTNGSTVAGAAVVTFKQDGSVGFGLTNPVEKVHSSAKIRANTAFNVNGTDGITVTDTVITALQDNAGQLQYKSKTITFTGGIRTATGVESDWTDVPTA
jgi:hypothetical protein